jgi:hypothetical protein
VLFSVSDAELLSLAEVNVLTDADCEPLSLTETLTDSELLKLSDVLALAETDPAALLLAASLAALLALAESEIDVLRLVLADALAALSLALVLTDALLADSLRLSDFICEVLLLSDSDLWLALFESEIEVLRLVLADALAALSLALVLTDALLADSLRLSDFICEVLLLSDSDLWLALFEFEIDVLRLVLADALTALSLTLVLTDALLADSLRLSDFICEVLLLSDSDLWLALFEFEIKVLWLVLADALAALSLSDFSVLSD